MEIHFTSKLITSAMKRKIAIDVDPKTYEELGRIAKITDRSMASLVRIGIKMVAEEYHDLEERQRQSRLARTSERGGIIE